MKGLTSPRNASRNLNPGWLRTGIVFSLVAAIVAIAGAQVTAAAEHSRVTETWVLDPARIVLQPPAGHASDAAAGQGPMRVRYPESIPAPVGAPDLPRVPVWIEVPAGMRAVGVKAEALGFQDLGKADIVPVARDRGGDEEVAPKAEPDPAIYGQASAYPRTWAELGSQGSLRGHWVVAVLVTPVQWNPATKALQAANRVEIELELRPASAAELALVAPRTRIVQEIEAKFEAGAEKVVRGLVPATPTESLAEMAGTGPAGPGPYQPTFRPTTDGSAVEYVIVTSQALSGEFQRLANWKTQKGVQAVVRTVEWIDQTYPNGVDRAERIRFFIRDAYQNWDTAFVLLGGDTEIVPPRYAQMVVFEGERIPSDYYYGCLDGNWNGDGDNRFGESLTGGFPGDEIDLIYELSVGRAPASTLADADAFVDKTLLYDQAPPAHTRYPHSILALAERLFQDLHGADIAQDALQLAPPIFQVRRLYEEAFNYPGALELTREAAIDSINHGFGIVHHVGHGFRNTMSMGLGSISNGDVDLLTNGPRNSVVFAINCSSASIDFNSIGERWLKNPNGGSIAYIGTSRVSFVEPSVTYQNTWYPTVLVDSVRTIGTATDQSRLILVPGADYDTGSRWNLLATTLLGDPEVDIYTNAVIPIQVTHPANVALGAAPITVTVMAQGAPVAGATVTLWKASPNDVYVRGTTGGAGTVQLPIKATVTGPLTLTVHKSYYRPYSSTVNVTAATGPYLFVNAMTVDDDNTGASSGDSDGQADAGEVIEYRLTLKNGGTQSATNVSATLVESDPDNCITITPGAVSYGTIAAGGSSQGTGSFLITIADSAPVACQPVLTVNITSTQGPWQDAVVLPLRRPYLEHYSHSVDDQAPRGDGDGKIEAGETIFYRVNLKNTGQDKATGVTGTLAALQISNHQPHPLVTVTDASSSFGTILPGASVLGDRFEFELAGNCDPATVLLQLTIADALGLVEIQPLDVLYPDTADSVRAFGSPTSIRLEWNRSASLDTRGYDVSRSSNPGGPFTRINEFTIVGSAAFEDPSLNPLTRYYYQVVSRDSSYNSSVPSVVVSASTNPPAMAGWPIEIGQQSQSSVVLSNTSGGSDYELFTGGDYVYGWHADGTEIRDGDGDPRTNGPFAPGGFNAQKGFGATTAIGDIDDNGDLEIANVGWTSESLYVWDHNGALVNGWPKWVMADFNWPSPVFFDLDGDRKMEVLVWSGGGGRLFAWHANGTEVIDGDNNPSTNGVFYRVFGTSFNYSSPAVGDIDGDGRPEIVVAVNISQDGSGQVIALNDNGTVCSGWPFPTGTIVQSSQVTSSPAIGDLDKNGTQEIVFAADRSGGAVYVLNGNGTLRSGWPRGADCQSGQGRSGSPVIGDINNDTFPDIVFPASNGELQVWDRNGNPLSGFPVVFATGLTEATQSSPALADIDGDNLLEIVFGDETGKVHAYNHDGTLVAGFPIQTTGEIRSTPIVWDIDQDGLCEVAVTGWDGTVYVWDLAGPFNQAKAPWPFFRHDVRNTGWVPSSVLAIGVADQGPQASVPARARVYPARPNPFNPATKLTFDVPGQGARPVTVGVYDVSGRLVRELLNGAVDPGQYTLPWDGRGANRQVLAAGVYFFRVTIGNQVLNEKVTLVK
jgi:hypothetical protein